MGFVTSVFIMELFSRSVVTVWLANTSVAGRSECICVSVYACACVRACVRACVCVCAQASYMILYIILVGDMTTNQVFNKGLFISSPLPCYLLLLHVGMPAPHFTLLLLNLQLLWQKLLMTKLKVDSTKSCFIYFPCTLSISSQKLKCTECSWLIIMYQ